MHGVHDLVDDGDCLAVDGACEGLEIGDGRHVVLVQADHLWLKVESRNSRRNRSRSKKRSKIRSMSG